MEIRYNLLPEDIVETRFAKIRKAPALRKTANLWRVAGAIFAISAIALYFFFPIAYVIIGFLLLLAIWFGVVVPALFTPIYRHAVKRSVDLMDVRGICGAIRLIASPNCLREETSAGNSEVTWDAVHDVLSMPQYVVIELSGDRSAVIPRREIPEKGLAQFLDEVEKHKSAARASGG